jgi:hypothetical protein
MQNEIRLQDHTFGTPCSTFNVEASCNLLQCLVIPITYVFKLQPTVGVSPVKANKQPSVRSYSGTVPTVAGGSELYVNCALFVSFTNL